MKFYRYETHAHTSEVSKCSIINSIDLVEYYKSIGFDGIFITDHFFNGNTRVPAELPWAEKVEFFCKGYENALEHGKKIGIDVFFGWEYSYHGTDFLTYGLDKEWLLRHSEIMDMSVTEYCDFIHEEGGFIVQAHPFREADYIEMIRLIPRHVDAIEVINASRNNFENNIAEMYADYYNLLRFAGSDNHVGKTEAIAGMQFKEALKNERDLGKAMLSGEGEIVFYNNF